MGAVRYYNGGIYLMDTFGSRLRSLRQKKGLTQRELAKLIGAKHNSISDWENDGHKPDMDTLEKLMGVFEVSSDYLLARDNQAVLDKDAETVAKRIIEEIAPIFDELSEAEAKLLIEFAKMLKKQLKWSDFDGGIINIKNNYVVANKKEYHRKVKTRDSERRIDIEGIIQQEFEAFKEKQIREGRIQTYVFEEGGRLPNPTHISRTLKTFQKANNLPLCRFHDLRHTFAVLQLEHGTDIDTLKRLLGHSKVGITSDTYLHENETLIKKASKALDNAIFLKCHNKVTINREKQKASE